MTIEQLEKFGLSHKEAGVYLALLELGPSIVSDIAKQSHVNRSTTYITLEALIKRGLVSFSDEKNVRIYSANPDHLIRSAEESAKKYADLASILKTALPKISKNKKETKPIVKVYEGDEGIKAVYEDAFSQKNKVQSVLPDTPDARERIQRYGRKIDESYFLDKEGKPFSAEINIYGNKTAFISPDTKSAVVVESEGFVEHMKTLFELSSEGLKRRNKKKAK